MEHVSYTIDNDTLYSNFDSTSPLVDMVHALNENKYTTVYVDSLTTNK